MQSKIPTHIRYIQIPAVDSARWEAAGLRLETMAPEVLVEISGLSAAPCKNRLYASPAPRATQRQSPTNR